MLSAVPYRPAPWLTNPHLQTVWGRVGRRGPGLPPHRRERWDTPDGDFVDLVRLEAKSSTAPTFLLLHGLESTVQSHFVSGVLRSACAAGWQANLLFFRTCSGEPNRLPRSYHSGETTDLDYVARRLDQERPDAPLVLAGVSLGGNVLLKWLGERGDDVAGRVAAAVAISVPYDLARSARHIDAHGRFYARRFLKTLRRKAIEKVNRFPRIADIEAIERANSLWAFDDAFTSVVHGFRDAADYYDRSSSLPYLHRIRVPTLLLSARDDPFHPPEVLDDVEAVAAENPALMPEFVEVGGHVGFVEGTLPWRTRSYVDRRVVEFGVGRLGMFKATTQR